MQGFYLKASGPLAGAISPPSEIPRRERNSSCPSLGLGEEPAGIDGIHHEAGAPSSGTNRKQGVVRTPGVGNHGRG